MSDDVKDFEDQGSSPDPVDAAAEITDATANSSDATPSEEAESDLLSVVRDVVGKDDKEPDAAASPAEEVEGTETGEPDAEEELSEDPSDEELAKYSSKTRRRIKKLLQERDELRPDAQNYRNVQNFLDAQGLTAEETADGLIIMGLMKTNPAEAWKRLKPTIQNLLIASGEILPDDLKGMVQRGEIAANAALEVSRSRANVQSAEAQRRFDQQRSEQRQQMDAAHAITSAAVDWEADRKRKDPNFEAKIEPLMKEVAFLQMREGKPKTPQGVREQLERAYKALPPPAARPSAPVRQAVTPVRGGQVAGNQAPGAQSTLDIIRARTRAS